MKLTKDETHAIATASNEPLKPGERFICIGPHCFGYGATAQEAIKNAKSNRVRIYEGKAGWRFLLFVAEDRVEVDGMGDFTWKPSDAEIASFPRATPKPYREIYRTPTLERKGA